MKHLFKILFVLALLCQVVFSQNNEIVKSFYFQADQSVGKGLYSTNITMTLKDQFDIPENYEFNRQVIKGTKNKMSDVG